MAANPQTKPTNLGCESADKWLLPSTSTITIYYYYSPRKLIRPTEGGRLSQPRHCRKGVQSMPKTVHRSGCRDKHNCPWFLTPQSIMQPLNHCDLQRHVGVNNLPNVVTRQRRNSELNLQPPCCKSNALTTRLPSQFTHNSSERMLSEKRKNYSSHVPTDGTPDTSNDLNMGNGNRNQTRTTAIIRIVTSSQSNLT